MVGLTAVRCPMRRVVCTDHGAFVLINVYVPNAGSPPERPRLPVKLRFLEAIKRKADALTASGRQARTQDQGIHPIPYTPTLQMLERYACSRHTCDQSRDVNQVAIQDVSG